MKDGGGVSGIVLPTSESNSRKTWALNAGVMLCRVRRGISYSFRGQYY
jgi:hypothetical protein